MEGMGTRQEKMEGGSAFRFFFWRGHKIREKGFDSIPNAFLDVDETSPYFFLFFLSLLLSSPLSLLNVIYMDGSSDFRRL